MVKVSLEVPVRRALVSVSDKSGIAEFAKELQASFETEVLSTGGTARVLRDAGIRVTDVSSVTGFPEMMDGRVKTLHPKIHGGLLARRDLPGHVTQAQQNGIGLIDLAVINLYPFEATIAKAGIRLEDAVEQIDIGGPAMVRSAAKNFASVAVVTSPSQYQPVLAELKGKNGALGVETRRKLALEAFTHTARYDAAISVYLAAQFFPQPGLPAMLPTAYGKEADLRYGENPHQKGALYLPEPRVGGPAMATAGQLHGKQLSYNNILDGDTALETVREFASSPAVAIIKHSNPCGVAVGSTLRGAYIKAKATDSEAAFGGVVALNREVDAETASLITAQFTDVVIAPSYSADALAIMTQKKKNLRVMQCGPLTPPTKRIEFRTVTGGLLAQESDDALFAELKTVTKRPPTDEELAAMKFAMTVCKHTKSNAVVYAFSDRTVGIGAGQMKRADSCRIGQMKASESLRGCAVASDAFFPFRDGIDIIASTGATAVIQPGGSINDQEVIDAANEHSLAMVFTGMRHFRH